MAAPAPEPVRPAVLVIPCYTQTLALVPSSVPLARLSVRTTVECWGLGVLADDAVLVASELVTNAVQHAAPIRRPGEEPGLCRLTVECLAAATVRIAVADPSRRRLVRRTPGAEDERGRGLVTVDALAASWDVEMRTNGKTVWAQLTADR